MKESFLLFLFLFICIGMEITLEKMTADQIVAWYDVLEKPVWAMPGSFFSSIWTFVYGSMAVAIWLFWRDAKKIKAYQSKLVAYSLFVLQLFLGGLWAYLFFVQHAFGAALVTLVLLWAVLLFTMMVFRIYSQLGSIMLIPNHLWVSYLLFFNATMWLMFHFQ